MKKINKISTGEQIRNFYLLGVYFLHKAEKHRYFMEENSAVFDHLNNLYLRCLFLGLSGEYLLKALFVKNGFSIKEYKKKVPIKKPAEAILENDYVVGYDELIKSLPFLSTHFKNLNQIGSILEKLRNWRNGAVHKFHLEKINEKDLEETYKILDELEEKINPDLRISASIYIEVYLDYKESNYGIRINTVKLIDIITDREVEAEQDMFDVERHFAYYSSEPSKKYEEEIEKHVIRQLHAHGYIFKNRNIHVEINNEIEKII